MQVEPFQTFLCDAPSNKIVTNKEELLGFFETMYRIRRMEIASDMLYKAKLIRGFCHLCAPLSSRTAPALPPLPTLFSSTGVS